MSEVACEVTDTCDYPQFAFKGLTAQWMGATTQMAPFTTNTITKYLQASAKGAANQCVERNNGTTCGAQWDKSSFDGNTGLGQQLSAMNVIVANLASNASVPGTGTSASTSSPGTSSTSTPGQPSTTASGAPSSLLPLRTAASTVSLLVFAAILFML